MSQDSHKPGLPHMKDLLKSRQGVVFRLHLHAYDQVANVTLSAFTRDATGTTLIVRSWIRVPLANGKEAAKLFKDNGGFTEIITGADIHLIMYNPSEIGHKVLKQIKSAILDTYLTYNASIVDTPNVINDVVQSDATEMEAHDYPYGKLDAHYADEKMR